MCKSIIRKNKSLVLGWAIFFETIISVFWSLICAMISVCGFLIYLH